MASRKHLVAVNRAVELAGVDEGGVHGPVVEFARDLARRLDAVGVASAPMDLIKTYQSALKDLQRALVPKSVAKPGRDVVETGPAEGAAPVGPPALTIVEESPLERVRREKAEARAAG